MALHQAIPPGVMARHGTSPLVPVKVPDLIGVRERHYLDATGLARHRDISDLMRYAAMNQTTDLHAAYRGFVPRDTGGDPVQFFKGRGTGRYSDEQLYALSLYLSLVDAAAEPESARCPLGARRGSVRARELRRLSHPASLHQQPTDHGARLHTACLRIPAVQRHATERCNRSGPCAQDQARNRLLQGSLVERRLVPRSVPAQWIRRHPRGLVRSCRLRDDYVPTGFKGYGIETRAVKGHPFGLKLSATDRQALIAFLRTL